MDTEKKTKICVIGGGSSGLAAIKCCLEEDLDVVCYEKSDYFGGLWKYHSDDADGKPSVMKSTVINTSKEMSAFSDFPPPEKFANFMHNSSMMEYFRLYAERFHLLKYIRYKHEVVQMEMTEDYETTGRWKVTLKNLDDNIELSDIFDGVMVCVGHHVYPYIPKFEGLDVFGGQVIHTHSLKSAEGFEDKTVLVIGIGNSAVDAAVEISKVSKKFTISCGESWDIQSSELTFNSEDSVTSLSCLLFLFPYLALIDHQRIALVHISVICETCGQYVGHVTPTSGTGSVVVKCILKYLEDNDVDINELKEIGCDGTATNTGWNNGVIRSIYLQIQRPMQWFICLLHFNELLFKHLFEYLDGETKGPTSFSGKIGKQLTNCEKLPITNFEKIELDEININKTDLSKDQQYLLDVVRAIQTGQSAPYLAVGNPGLSVTPDG
ncbi:Dimethylaniline monooxygenase [N-oxide-forming] 2 [Araneus ventricosus]|uniref:Flavin-containing monooxygenase n=1 Tax=Araneus ventricosus TaxID=182803 RepID=A0A4Y2APY5_ARAVE|nr:Dimethylaniline monooxygenase [N-oxide-forming] 2 [Araneus ventricosus]